MGHRGLLHEEHDAGSQYLNVAVHAEKDEEVVALGLGLAHVGHEQDAARAGSSTAGEAETGLLGRQVQLLVHGSGTV